MAMAMHALVHVDRFAIAVGGRRRNIVGGGDMDSRMVRRFVGADQGIGHRNPNKRNRGQCDTHKPDQALKG